MHRGIPATRHGIREQLANLTLESPVEYMLCNLGLSLTDHYWVCPGEKRFTWEEIDSYTNEFQSWYSLDLSDDERSIAGKTNFVPSGSLKRNRTWKYRGIWYNRNIGFRDFRKQNLALGQDGTWKSGGTDPKEFQKAAWYVVWRFREDINSKGGIKYARSKWFTSNQSDNARRNWGIWKTDKR